MTDSKINFSKGRPGRLKKQATSWAQHVRERAEGKHPGAVLLAETAVDVAALADASRTAGDGRTYLAAVTKLQTVMDRVEKMLPAGAGGTPDEVADDAWSAEMDRILRAGPELGDFPES